MQIQEIIDAVSKIVQYARTGSATKLTVSDMLLISGAAQGTGDWNGIVNRTCSRLLGLGIQATKVKITEPDGFLRLERASLGQIAAEYNMQQHDRKASLDTVDDAARSVEAVLVTEARVRTYDPIKCVEYDEILLASGGSWATDVTLHNRHQKSVTIGKVRRIQRVGSEWRGSLCFATDQVSNRAWDHVRQGLLNGVSAGYTTDYLATQVVLPGQTRTIQGRKFTAQKTRELRVVEKWRGTEASLAPNAADSSSRMLTGDRSRNGAPRSSIQYAPIVTARQASNVVVHQRLQSSLVDKIIARGSPVSLETLAGLSGETRRSRAYQDTLNMLLEQLKREGYKTEIFHEQLYFDKR